jgi:hypothetical protein
MGSSNASSAPSLILLFLVLSLASALPVQHHPRLHPRQGDSGFEDSGTDYTGYTLEGCQEVFGVCKGHLVHPGHVPGGKKQCVFEMGESRSCILDERDRELMLVVRDAEKCNDTVNKAAVAVVPVP